jgi:hypothetical protein
VRTRRAGRFLLEVAFLGGLAALAALAKLRPEAVIGVMAFGWVVVALAEWSSWLNRPHYGRGLPPRYYLPQQALPPPALEEPRPIPASELAAFEPQTGVISLERWSPSLDEWPAIDLEQLGRDRDAADAQLEQTSALPAAAAPGEITEYAAPEVLLADTEVVRMPPAEAPLPPPAPELPAAPPPQPPHAPPARTPTRRSGAPAAASRRARHRVDPFAAAGGGSRLRRREADNTIEVPARPPADRPPPSSLRRAAASLP